MLRQHNGATTTAVDTDIEKKRDCRVGAVRIVATLKIYTLSLVAAIIVVVNDHDLFIRNRLRRKCEDPSPHATTTDQPLFAAPRESQRKPNTNMSSLSDFAS